MLSHSASIHLVEEVNVAVENQMRLPPYSSDLNPAEVFSQVKSLMKLNNMLFQGCSKTCVLIPVAFSMVTREDCVSYIRHAGYL